MAMKIRVMMLGLRSFPDVQGGVEKHAESLSRELAAMGQRVEVIVRARYTKPHLWSAFPSIKFIRIWAPNSPFFEAIIHSVLGVLYAAWWRPDILHIHAIGPALVTPLARILGLRVVFTHHGEDYKREKWGAFAKAVLRCGERWAVKFAHGRIAVSTAIARSLKEAYAIEANVIPNGIDAPVKTDGGHAIDRFGLARGRYILMVGRLVPEKRHLDAIEAFRLANLAGWKLVVVGESDFQTGYLRRLQHAIKNSTDVVELGFQSGRTLAELYANSGIFVLSSSHEGLPIALLEALSFGATVVASDIAPNLEFNLGAEQYFPVGDVAALAGRFKHFARNPIREAASNRAISDVLEKYSWRQIAMQTLQVYSQVLSRSESFERSVSLPQVRSHNNRVSQTEQR